MKANKIGLLSIALITAALAAASAQAEIIIVDADAAAFDDQDISTFFPGVTLAAVSPNGPVLAKRFADAITGTRVFGWNDGGFDDQHWGRVNSPDFKATFSFLAQQVSIDYDSDVGGTLSAYDANGMLLGTDTEPGGNGTFTFTAAGNAIKSIVVSLQKVGGDFGTLDHLVIVTVNPFQIRYTSNLNVADAFIDITNTGESATAAQTQPVPNAQFNINGSICANIYAFAADEQEVSCCSCLVTPNGLYSLSVRNALVNSVLTSSTPNELVVKLISSVPASSTDPSTGLITQTCNPGTVSTTGALANGLLAWGTSTHGFPAATGPNFQLTETPFAVATLSTAELTRDVEECQFIQILGSGQFGMCKGCQNAGLGAAAQ